MVNFNCKIFLATFLLCSCNRVEKERTQLVSKKNHFEVVNCVLAKKTEITEIVAFEEKQGSWGRRESTVKTKGKPILLVQYTRRMLPDSIPYTVKYAFRQDTAMAVMYRWENLTGKKPVIEFTRKQLLALMKKRYGKPGAGIDHRKETTRIDFDDYYSWQKRGEPRAAIFYHDSMSAGETVLTLEISFDPELKIPGLFIE